jgi:hypothetical protein
MTWPKEARTDGGGAPDRTDDLPALAQFAGRRRMRTDDLLSATLTLTLALEGKDRTVAKLEELLERVHDDRVVLPRHSIRRQ